MHRRTAIDGGAQVRFDLTAKNAKNAETTGRILSYILLFPSGEIAFDTGCLASTIELKPEPDFL
jgi:hypothetical protein